MDNFVVTNDSDHNEGNSVSTFDIGNAGRAIFHGNLDCRVPKDGKIKRAGYCAIRSKRVRVSCLKLYIISFIHTKPSLWKLYQNWSSSFRVVYIYNFYIQYY